MALMGAMYSSSSAMGIFGEAMGVIGNNLANTSTTGFKASQVTFQDVLSQSVGYTVAEGSNQVGNGASVASVSQSFQQGSFQQTGMSTDMAIDGAGYFQVKDPNKTVPYYTRAGDFKRDKTGALVTGDGFVLQGVPITEEGNIVGAPTDIILDNSITAAMKATSRVNVAANLDATAVASTLPYDPNDPDSYNFAVNARVYDSKGLGHNVEIQFRKSSTADNTWEWYPAVATQELVPAAIPAPVVPDGDMTNVFARTAPVAAAGASYSLATLGGVAVGGLLEFSPSGYLINEGAPPVTFSWDGGTLPQQVLFNFGNAVDPSGYGDATNDYGILATDLTYPGGPAVSDITLPSVGGTVQFASPSTTMNLDQDGFPPGFLERINVNREGVIVGHFSNGQNKELYQIRLASFVNEAGLDTAGKNLYSETVKSGMATPGFAGSGKFGAVIGNSLEQSNVDISEEVIRMIGTQRAFQANSRIVSVVDGMLEELVNLKR